VIEEVAAITRRFATFMCYLKIGLDWRIVQSGAFSLYFTIDLG
jgi:hypothetical protein